MPRCLRRGLRPCPKGLCPSGLPTLAGGSLGSRGYGPLALHSCPRAERRVAPAASRGRVLALRAAGRTNPLTRHPLGTADRMVRSGGCFGWKGCQGRHRRPQPGAQRRDRARMPGEAFTLDAPGSHPAYRPGGGTRRSRRACPRSQSGKIGRGMQPKGLPKRSAERSRAEEIQSSFTHSLI